jgi:hypothetical protein
MNGMALVLGMLKMVLPAMSAMANGSASKVNSGSALNFSICEVA